MICSVLSVCFGDLRAQADEKLSIKSTSPIKAAADRYKPRPKFIVFEVESIGKFNVNALSDLAGNASARVRENLVRQVKVKFPIILKEGLNVIGGVDYRHEQFKFDMASEPDYPLFQRFEDKALKRISTNFYLKKTLKNKRFVFAYLNNSLNSDVPQFNNFEDQLKASVTFVYGKQANPNKQIGYGVSFGYDLGQPSVFPLFIYNHDFSLHWGVQLLLPKSAQLRYSPSNAMHFYAITELKGASYHIQGNVLTGFDQLEFRRSSVRFNLRVEHEIYDWLWFGVTAGYRVPINIFLSEPRKNRRDSLVEVDAQSIQYYNFSIFIVPPTKLYNRAKGSG